jgi:hypothetical protein
VKNGQVQQQKEQQVQQLSEVATQNLQKNSELWKAESVYVKLEDGETRILQFNPEKIKQVAGQYGLRIQYMVMTRTMQTNAIRNLKQESQPVTA